MSTESEWKEIKMGNGQSYYFNKAVLLNLTLIFIIYRLVSLFRKNLWLCVWLRAVQELPMDILMDHLRNLTRHQCLPRLLLNLVEEYRISNRKAKKRS